MHSFHHHNAGSENFQTGGTQEIEKRLAIPCLFYMCTYMPKCCVYIAFVSDASHHHMEKHVMYAHLLLMVTHSCIFVVTTCRPRLERQLLDTQNLQLLLLDAHPTYIDLWVHLSVLHMLIGTKLPHKASDKKRAHRQHAHRKYLSRKDAPA